MNGSIKYLKSLIEISDANLKDYSNNILRKYAELRESTSSINTGFSTTRKIIGLSEEIQELSLRIIGEERTKDALKSALGYVKEEWMESLNDKG